VTQVLQYCAAALRFRFKFFHNLFRSFFCFLKMSSSKIALKAIKISIDSADFTSAAEKASALVKADPKSYTGLLFLGFARDKLGQNDEAEKAYQLALSIKPTDPQALKGLIALYEKQHGTKLDQYHEAVTQLAEIYAEQGDRAQCQNAIDKYELFAKKYGSQAQYRHALELLLPTSSLYDVLEGRIPHPSHTYTRILESAEVEERDWINKQIGERRTRLGSKLDQVTQIVRYEAITKFQIEQKYTELIDWMADDDARHILEEKLFRRAFDNLIALPSEQKPLQREKVLKIADGMVIIKHPFDFAWEVSLNWVNSDSLQHWDVNIFRDFIDFFPENGLSKVLQGFLDSDISPFAQDTETPCSESSDAEVSTKLTEADRLILMVEGLEDCPDSLLANRIMAEMYLSLGEHQSATDIGRKLQELHLQAIEKYGLDLQNSLDAVNIILANALISYQSPRHHPEAKSLFESILQRKPTLTAALLGIGLILEEDEDYHEAVQFLQQAAERDSSNLRIELELAWCRALDGDLEHGLAELERIIASLEVQNTSNLSMKAEVLYRIAYCKWHIEPSSSLRKLKSGAYRYLIDSIKADPSYAPAYTLLGFYFQDYGKSKQRARVALQKAFELSTSEVAAAERLAKLFADTAEWDLVELVAQRVVDSGKAKPAPGSKKKAFSWPYAALGTVQMNKQQYATSIVSFQSALRISPEDYHSWVGLGESYHNSGRYIAATRAFMKAESLDHDLPAEQTWFAKYMLANVQREMGSFDDAISAYENVLTIVNNEFGVLIALLQTFAENAWAKIELGMFGEAAQLAMKALQSAEGIVQSRSNVFNLWKAVGDACSVLASTRVQAMDLDLGIIPRVLLAQIKPEEVQILADVDKIEQQALQVQTGVSAEAVADFCLAAAILAHKRSIHSSMEDVYARAVSWYNLGWAEYQAYLSAEMSLKSNGKKPQRFLKASMRCFKRAIEFEAGNADFWNALGITTMIMSPKVSQHSFVRCLHLNENSARTWTNLGALYLVNNENQLANEAFTRSQSADPEYAHAWIGQGLLAILYGNIKEARGLFLHAFDISSASSPPAKQQYAMSAFDALLKDSSKSHEVVNILQPLFALRRLRFQTPSDPVFLHLSALFAERVGSYDEAAMTIKEICLTTSGKALPSRSREQTARYLQAQADLARSQLALGSSQDALKSTQVILSYPGEDDLGPAYEEVRRKWRLSAHVTAGLASHIIGNIDESIKMFQAALEEANQSPEVVCMLAQVLWAKGGVEERDTAREHLFACIEEHPGNVQAAILLAVIGLLDGDEDILEAVEDDLRAMRVSAKVSIQDKMKVTKVLSGIVACKPSQDSDGYLASLAEATKGVMLAPGQPQGWSELADATNDPFSAQMALRNAAKQVPPGGSLEAEDLATALANTGMRKDALQAIVLTPWIEEGYRTITHSL
jgi:superkiller protein 3